MAIDLNKNREALLNAYNDVANDKTDSNWALFGYEGKSNVLKAVETGSGGIDELVDEVNSSKVQYAYCRIKDPNTDLPKYLLINWQGEAAPENIKFKCSNHMRDIKGLFKGIHMTLNARTEDDLDLEDIKKKIAKSSGSNYSFHKEQSKPEPPPAPVSSVYKKTYAKRDINTKRRDDFWAKTEEEEKKRQKEDKDRQMIEKANMEQARKEREEMETTERERMIRQKMKVVNQQKFAETRANSHDKNVEKEKWAKVQIEAKMDEEERRSRSESLRKERAAEVVNVASNTTHSKRAMFEQRSREVEVDPRSGPPLRKLRHSFVSQDDEHTPSPTVSESRFSFHEKSCSPEPAVAPPQPRELTPEPAVVVPKARSISPQPEPAATAINVLKDNLPRRQDSEYEEEEDDEEEEEDEESGYDAMTIKRKAPATTEAISAEPEPVASAADRGICVLALYDYQAADDTEISFDPDDIITNVEMIDEGWWNGVAPNGEYGMFPANYVEMM